MQVTLDKIASVTSRLKLPAQIETTGEVPAERGAVIVVEAMEEKEVYGELELVGGRLARIIKGDLIAGVLGERQALKGFVGSIPDSIRPGDTLHMLNMGGVIGRCSSANSDFGQPLRVRVVGAAVGGSAIGQHGYGAHLNTVNIADNAIEWQNNLPFSAPVILVSGTCMNAGKTTAACEIIRVLRSRGYTIAGAKLAGVATQRDVLNMQDHGATYALSFSDAGLPSTTHTDSCIVAAAKGVLTELNRHAPSPDAIIVEFGDGIMGHYGVDWLLRDRELMSHVRAHILCANDLVGAWGGLKYLQDDLGLEVDCISGPATDNSAGIDYINKHMNKPAANGRKEPVRLADIIEKCVFPTLQIPVRQKVVA